MIQNKRMVIALVKQDWLRPVFKNCADRLDFALNSKSVEKTGVLYGQTK
jgi:hypothetical protein